MVFTSNEPLVNWYAKFPYLYAVFRRVTTWYHWFDGKLDPVDLSAYIPVPGSVRGTWRPRGVDRFLALDEEEHGFSFRKFIPSGLAVAKIQ